MEKQQKLNPQTGEQENESNINVKDIIFIVLNNWMWFALSVFLCLLATAFYYKSQPKEYTNNATILLRDNAKGGAKGQNMDAIFATMGFDNTNLSLENEMYIIKSTPLMMSVVERLGLNTWCTRDKMFRKETYYKNNPLQLHFYNTQVDSVPISMAVEVSLPTSPCV